MKKILLTLALSALALGTMAKSIVLTLNDKAGTRVYYLLGGESNPKLVFNGDGTFSMNGTDYTFKDIKYFEYSKTDYSGEDNTVDGIGAPTMEIRNNQLNLSGTTTLKIYSMDGRLLRCEENARQLDMRSLQKGTYVITDGVSTLKIQKR